MLTCRHWDRAQEKGSVGEWMGLGDMGLDAKRRLIANEGGWESGWGWHTWGSFWNDRGHKQQSLLLLLLLKFILFAVLIMQGIKLHKTTHHKISCKHFF